MKFEFTKKEMRHLLIEEWDNECFIYETYSGVVVCLGLHDDGEQSEYYNEEGVAFENLDHCESFMVKLFSKWDEEQNGGTDEST